MGPTITVTKKLQGRRDVDKALIALRRAEVLVGIPQARASRRGEQINNAELMYIHTHGSPIRHIPARPVIEPAINAAGNKEIIVRELGEAAAAWLKRDSRTGLMYLKRAGMAAMNASKAWFTDPRNNWAPNRRSTVLAKLRKLQGKKYDEAVAQIEGMDEIGNLPGINTILVDTGALRKAITYVVRTAENTPTEAQQLELENVKKA